MDLPRSLKICTSPECSEGTRGGKKPSVLWPDFYKYETQKYCGACGGVLKELVRVTQGPSGPAGQKRSHESRVGEESQGDSKRLRVGSAVPVPRRHVAVPCGGRHDTRGSARGYGRGRPDWSGGSGDRLPSTITGPFREFGPVVVNEGEARDEVETPTGVESRDRGNGDESVDSPSKAGQEDSVRVQRELVISDGPEAMTEGHTGSASDVRQTPQVIASRLPPRDFIGLAAARARSRARWANYWHRRV